ncbi:MAG: ParB/RepB/Spo0J family partition protein [Actinomycetota bacterium]
MSPRTALGKGLGALIPTGARSLEELSTEQIYPNPNQPRRRFDEDALVSLAASIRQLGLLQPVVVRVGTSADDGQERYELVMGERRWRAARRAGLTMIPALIVETDDRGALERALVENLHRQDLNPLEEAAAYSQLLTEAGLTHEQLAERVGLSRPAVTNTIRLLELPDSVKVMVAEGKLSAGHARALLALVNGPHLQRISQRVIAEGLSVRQTEDLVRDTKEGTERSAVRPPGAATAIERNPGLAEISERVGDHLGTRVSVTMGKKKGKLIIEFATPDDLDRIVEAIAPHTVVQV